MVRPDALPFEPVRIGPVWGPDEGVFYSRYMSDVSKKLQVVDFTRNLDSLTYIYYAIGTYLIAAFILLAMAFTRELNQSSPLTMVRQCVKIFYSTLWSIFKLLIDQEHYYSDLSSLRTVWLFYTASIFVTIYGFLLNLMSTEMVAYVKPVELHSILDYLSPQFKECRATIYKNFPIYNLIKASALQTNLGRLYERISMSNESVTEINFNTIAEVTELRNSIVKSVRQGNTLIVPRYFLKLILLVGCYTNAKTTQQIYESKHAFAIGVATSFFSRLTDGRLVKYIEYRIRTKAELHLVSPLGPNVVQSALSGFGLVQDFDVHKCIHKQFDKPANVFNAMLMNSLQSLIVILSVIFAIAFGTLILELLISYVSKRVIKQSKVFQAETAKRRLIPMRPITDFRQAGRTKQNIHWSENFYKVARP